MTTPATPRDSVLTKGEPLPAGDTVYHRLAAPTADMIAVDQATGARRPSSGAFKPDSDGVSVYSQWAMTARDLQLGHLLRRDGNLLVGLDVNEIRTLDGLNVVGDPWPEDIEDPQEAAHPRNAAHALITGLPETKKARIRRQGELARLSSVALLHPTFEPALANASIE